jgi:hypothetical protein
MACQVPIQEVHMYRAMQPVSNDTLWYACIRESHNIASSSRCWIPDTFPREQTIIAYTPTETALFPMNGCLYSDSLTQGKQSPMIVSGACVRSMCLLELESWARADYMLVSALRCTGSTQRTLNFPIADLDAVVGTELDRSCVLLKLNLCSLWTALEIPTSSIELNDGSMFSRVSRSLLRAFKLLAVTVWVFYASQWGTKATNLTRTAMAYDRPDERWRAWMKKST